MDTSNIPTCPGCTRSDWPASCSGSARRTVRSRPGPGRRRRSRKPSPAKTPALKDCWKPGLIWMPGVPARNPCRCTITPGREQRRRAGCCPGVWRRTRWSPLRPSRNRCSQQRRAAIRRKGAAHAPDPGGHLDGICHPGELPASATTLSPGSRRSISPHRGADQLFLHAIPSVDGGEVGAVGPEVYPAGACRIPVTM